MTVLWWGAEEFEFTQAVGVTISTSTTYKKSTQRYSMQPQGLGGGFLYRAFQSATSIWCGIQRYNDSSDNTQRTFAFTAGAGNSYLPSLDRLALKQVSSAVFPTAVQLVAYDGTEETVLATSTGNLYLGYNRWDIQVSNYNSASGVFRLYSDAALILEYTGDLRSGGATALDGFVCRSPGNTSNKTYWSQFILADEDTRPYGVYTSALNADVSNGWAGGTYTALNETTLDDSTNLYTSTPDAYYVGGTADLTAGNWTIAGVKAVVRAMKVPGSIQPVTKIKAGFRIGATDYRLSDVQTLLDWAYGPFEHVLPINPVTGVEWTLAEINALNFAMQAIA